MQPLAKCKPLASARASAINCRRTAGVWGRRRGRIFFALLATSDKHAPKPLWVVRDVAAFVLRLFCAGESSDTLLKSGDPRSKAWGTVNSAVETEKGVP